MERTVVVESVDTVDAAHETSLSVEVTSVTVAQGSPATLQIRVRNESGTKRDYKAGKGTRPVFSRVESETRNPGVALVTRSEAQRSGISLDALPDDCRLASLPSSGYYLALHYTTLDSGDVSTIGLDLYGHPENDDRVLPTGTFRFEEIYRYRGLDDGEDRGQFEWAFSVGIQ